ncbi:MAG: phenylalanine--tRNA ligase subunit alpha [Treponema sp.]|jgi:phenylalanyl-tRNA synthetase alpha chain|nr:phenylalanine--tRNA ligase subunit alpha [Treponema sp.]
MSTDIKNIVKNLHPLEIKILLNYKKGDELTIERVERELGFKPGNGNQALSWLAGKGLISELRRETAVFYELTGIGEEWKEKGSPEERILELIRQKIKKDEENPRLPEIARALNVENKDIGSAFGSLSKLGILSMDGDKKVVFSIPLEHLDDPAKNPMLAHFNLVRGLFKKIITEKGLLAEASLNDDEKKIISGIAKKRGAADAPFRQIDRETVFWGFSAAKDGSVPAEKAFEMLKVAGITGDETGSLTQAMLEEGSWKGKVFRPYNVKTPPVRLTPGRSNPYAKFLENVKDKLSSLGFEEFDGPLVETEFWNSDALFMPQFHSARDIHDAYSIAEPASAKQPSKDGVARAKSIDEPWLSNVSSTHENGGKTGSRGWNYGFDREFTKRLILRSQGTALSAKQLPTAKIPGKYFGIARCFRYDRVDATHLPDFYQTEGIVLGENVNLRTLLGMLEMFACEVAGAKEVKYVPGYFPFTEPSVEVHIKHPVLGWFELGGSGIFRPEVTESLGINVPVAAWGIGIDRMALMALGLNDLRELFSHDIENVRLRRAG